MLVKGNQQKNLKRTQFALGFLLLGFPNVNSEEYVGSCEEQKGSYDTFREFPLRISEIPRKSFVLDFLGQLFNQFIISLQ